MKRRILTLFIGLAAAFLLCSCSGNPLPEGMDETTVLDAGRAVITDLTEENWQNVYDQLREDAKATTPSPDSIAEYMQTILAEIGPYQREEDAMATGQKLDSGEAYATAVFYCKHEKDNAMYRIAFSTDMELMGIQITER